MNILLINAFVNCWRGTNVYSRAVNFKKSLDESGYTETNIICRLDLQPGREPSSFVIYKRTQDLFRFFKFSIKNMKPHIMHVYDPCFPSSPICMKLAKIADVPVVVDTGDLHYMLALISERGLFERFFVKTLEELALISSTRIIVRSRGLFEVLLSSGFNMENLVYVPDGVDLNFFRPKKSHLRESMGFDDKFVVGYLGRLREIRIENLVLGRGWELLKAMRELIERGKKNLVLLMVGDGPAREELRNMAQQLGLIDYVVFTGYVKNSEVPDYINAMDVCFLDSYQSLAYKAMINTKLLQYMACGKCVIAGNIGESSYLLKDCGMLIEPCSMKKNDLSSYVFQICEKIELAMENPVLLDRLGRKARKRAVELFDWRKLAKQVYSVYLGCLR